jgi:hypothetical protein
MITRFDRKSMVGAMPPLLAACGGRAFFFYFSGGDATNGSE